MTTQLPWRVRGARLHLPRDRDVAYVVGRMGVVTLYDLYLLFWASVNTARFGFGRLVKLGLLRTFERDSPSHAAWYSITPEGAEWVLGETGCDEGELRIVSGIRRMNLSAMGQRNRLWVSLALACRATGGEVSLALFRPEWELRRMKPSDVSIVPDALVALIDRKCGAETQYVWMIELDAGTERSSVWKQKAENYAALRGQGLLYGAAHWNVLALVPSARRARTVAEAVSNAGCGAFTFLATAEALMEGRALSSSLWRAVDLAASRSDEPSASLLGAAANQRGRSAADRLSGPDSGVTS